MPNDDTPQPLEPLTARDVIILHQILTAATANRRVRWLAEDGDTILDGVARHVTDERGMFLPPTIDIRTGYLRISNAMEWFLPIADVMDRIENGEFGIED